MLSAALNNLSINIFLMEPHKYLENDLPIRELENLGLASNGRLIINTGDLQALLSGRRTSLLHLEDLAGEGLKIKKLPAKISLRTDTQGKTELLLHPVYKKANRPGFLNRDKAEKLEKGALANILKAITDEKGKRKKILVEFDEDTREFVISDTEKIQAPDRVNNELLSEFQKDHYRKGREVKLADGTVFRYSGTDSNGLRSNKLALVASILVDGGLSFALYKGLNALFGKKQDPADAKRLSRGYYTALRNMGQKAEPAELIGRNENGRAYARRGFSH
jgi:hypothetical protein